VLPVCGIDYRFTANFGDFLPIAIKGPTADFSPANYVLHKLDSVPESDRELVKQFNVLEKIVIRVPR
jgi:hypothetical protein